MTADLDALAAGLTKAQVRLLTDPRFRPKGWEPPDPFSPLLTSLVEAGVFRRADGRCGFEAFKNSFVVPTPLGLALRARLSAGGGE